MSELRKIQASYEERFKALEQELDLARKRTHVPVAKSSETPVAAVQIGSSPYEILRQIGRGGQADVYYT